MEGKQEPEKLWEKAGRRFCLVFPFLNPCPCPLCPVNRPHSPAGVSSRRGGPLGSEGAGSALVLLCVTSQTLGWRATPARVASLSLTAFPRCLRESPDTGPGRGMKVLSFGSRRSRPTSR